MSNVYQVVANVTGYKNLNVTGDAIPLTNLTTTIPGPLNAALYQPFAAPNTSGSRPGGGPVFVAPGVDTNLTAAALPAPTNVVARAPVPQTTDEGQGGKPTKVPGI